MFQYDCHAHEFETTATVPNARYVPKSPAPLTSWLKHLESNDLKGGVLVQVSFLGTDNSQLCAALERLDRTHFAGVAVVPVDVTETELDRLVAYGVRGLRWNLVHGGTLPDLKEKAVQELFSRMRARNLHLDVHLEGPRLATWLPDLSHQGLDIVVDHFGLPSEPRPQDDPLQKVLKRIPERGNIFFKLSAPYRTPFDLRPHGQELAATLGDSQLLWGSDWPHTQHEDFNYSDVVSAARNWRWRGESASGAAHLYGRAAVQSDIA